MTQGGGAWTACSSSVGGQGTRWGLSSRTEAPNSTDRHVFTALPILLSASEGSTEHRLS